MVRITEDLVRKKAEHNEGIIGTLEELSLHQEDVEKIEHLNNWCKELQILYLQANLIAKIENVNKLKKLEYLNLAINNVEVIENLERCESLEKLDLTLNFIGDLQSVKKLRLNHNLKHLYLTGNPCCDFSGYRQFVVANLPNLVTLDGTQITRSERIQAVQQLPTIEPKIKQAEKDYKISRKEQLERSKYNLDTSLSDDEFWKSSSEHSPESRVEIARRSRKLKKIDEEPEIVAKKEVKYFAANGRPLNINQAKLDFVFKDDDPEKIVLDLAVYKYLDTSLIDIDLQPVYVRITIKEKIFQMVLPEEISTDRSIAKRSEVTGHLHLEMPRANYKPVKLKAKATKQGKPTSRQFLEVEDNSMDFSKICESKLKFEDDLSVPRLEYG